MKLPYSFAASAALNFLVLWGIVHIYTADITPYHKAWCFAYIGNVRCAVIEKAERRYVITYTDDYDGLLPNNGFARGWKFERPKEK